MAGIKWLFSSNLPNFTSSWSMECLVRSIHTDHFRKKIPGGLLLGINNQDITFPVRFDPAVNEVLIMAVMGNRILPGVHEDQQVTGIVFFIVGPVFEQAAGLIPCIPVAYGG